MSVYINSDLSERTTAVVPAYNEAEHIGAVLNALWYTNELHQIIVVDDGSVDDTPAIVDAHRKLDARIQLIRLPANRGKGGAMVAGAEASRNDLVVFLDADLIGLRPEHVLTLSQPVCNGACSMTRALFRHGRRATDYSHKLLPFLSGQRCLRWSLFQSVPEMENARWGVEIALNLHAWRNHYDVQVVPWPGVSHALRPEKVKDIRGYWSHLQMWLDIGKYLVRHFRDKPKEGLKTRYLVRQ